MRTMWTARQRQRLEYLLREEFLPVNKIAPLMGMSPTTIYKEIKKAISEDEYKNKQYGKYTAKAAIDADIRELQGHTKG